MKIVRDGQRFVLQSGYGDRHFARDAGFQWDREHKVWAAWDPILVSRLRGTPNLTISPEARDHLTRLQVQSDLAVAASRALSSDFYVPVPDGIDNLTGKPFEYLPFQLAGIKYAFDRQDTLIGDQMGVGKTIQAIGTNNADPSSKKIIIICPAFLKDNWYREFTKWDVKHLNIDVVRSGRVTSKTRLVNGEKIKVTDEARFPDGDVIITSFELLESWRRELRDHEHDMLIVDECHYLKNGKADRTKEIFGCRANTETDQESISAMSARRRLFLSGTPFLNRPRELWGLVHSIDPRGLGGNRMYFEKRYCDGKMIPIIPKSTLLFNGAPSPEVTDTSIYRKVWSALGSTHPEELQRRMRSIFMVRRLRADVLPMLPIKQRQIIVVDAPGVGKLLERERKTYEQYSIDLETMDIHTPGFTEMSKIRREIGIKMAPFIIEKIESVLKETDKLCVFVYHHEVIDAVRDRFRDCCAVLDGRVPVDERQAIVDRFQNDEQCRIILGTFGAMSEGWTLTAAYIALLGELEWRSTIIDQAEDRLCRMGQKRNVLIQHLVLAGSLAERQVQLIIKKQQILDRTLDTGGVE